MKRQSVLVVDDDPDLRHNISQALLAEGYQVFEANNGQEALSLLNQKYASDLIGCIILDLMMPIMDGESFLNEIKTTYASSLGEIPIVVATAKGSAKGHVRLPANVERLKKPMELEDLYAIVRKHCGEPGREPA